MTESAEAILLRADNLKDNNRKKYYISQEIYNIKNILQNSFMKKIKTGKINKDHVLMQMNTLQKLIEEHNKIQVYVIKEDIVIPRDTTQIYPISFDTALDKASCKLNLEKLSQVK